VHVNTKLRLHLQALGCRQYGRLP